MPGKEMSDASVHSPAGDLSKGFNIGGASKPPAPSVHSPCNFNMGDSDAPVGSTFGDADARTPVSLEEVQLATGIPEANQGQLGESLIGDLDKPIRG